MTSKIGSRTLNFIELSVITAAMIKIIRNKFLNTKIDQSVQNRASVTVERFDIFTICDWIKSKGYTIEGSCGSLNEYPSYYATRMTILSKDPVFGVRKRFQTLWSFFDGCPLLEQYGVLYFEAKHHGADPEKSWVFHVNGEVNLEPMTSLMRELSSQFGMPIKVRLVTINRKSEYVGSGY